MSSSSDTSLITSLNTGIVQLNRYLGIFIFLFGIVGNTLNILVLSQRLLRLNSCTWLFLVSSIFNFIALLAGVISRFLSTWSADLTNTNQFLCKIRAFLLFDGITISAWLITLATVDRWLSSNIDANRRRKSTLKNAQRGTILIIVLSSIIETQQIYCFEANLVDTPIKCYTRTILCSIVSDLTFALLSILFPLIFMFIFGWMTISNVRKVRSRVQPITMIMNGHESTTTGNGYATERKKSDRHLLIMLFIQVLLILLFTFPMAIYKLYTTITRNLPKSTLNNTIENLLFNIFLLFVYVSCGMPFYIYTLSGGRVFRKALVSLLKTLLTKMTCRCR